MSELGASPTGGSLGFLQELDGDREGQFNAMGRNLVNGLFVLLRSAGMHDLNNDALIRPTQGMIDAVGAFMKAFHEEASIQLVDGTFFVNKRLLRLDFSTFQNARYLRRIFEFLGVNELTFTQAVDKSTLHSFLLAFLKVVRERQGAINDYPLGSIRLRKVEVVSEDVGETVEEPRVQVLNIYASGLLMLRSFVNDLRRGKSPRHSRVKRLCLDLIDVEPRYHNLLLALLHLENYKGNLFCHMLNTAVLAIVFGQRLGLTRNQLVDLGMAAFHHDLGWALVGTLDQQGAGDPALDLDGVQYSPQCTAQEMDDLRTKVAQALVRMGGFNESVINRMIVAFECQIPEDAAAVGLYYNNNPASFMTHVVRMASFYDELTTGRPHRPALPPDQVMRRILDDGGRTFDPFLGKLFGNCIGAYPVGTVVELDTAELGLVVNLPTNPVNFHRPQVKLLVDNAGRPLGDRGAIVDLNETFRGGSKYLRTIERTQPPAHFSLSVTRFFFG